MKKKIINTTALMIVLGATFPGPVFAQTASAPRLVDTVASSATSSATNGTTTMILDTATGILTIAPTSGTTGQMAGPVGVYLDKIDKNSITSIVIASGVSAPVDSSNLFTSVDFNYLMPNVKSLDVSNLNTSEVTNMSGMFNGLMVSKLDVTNFDTSKVTDMDGMFSNMYALSQLNVRSFDTSNVILMYQMFSGDSSLTKLDVSNFDTRNVTDIGGIFSFTPLQALTLSSLFQIPANQFWGLGEPMSGTGKWQNVGSGTEANPMGSIVLDTSSLENSYRVGEIPPSKQVETYVWQPDQVAQIPANNIIQYGDGKNELFPQMPLPAIIGNVGEFYTILDAPVIPGYNFKKVTYNGGLVQVGDAVILKQDGYLNYYYERAVTSNYQISADDFSIDLKDVAAGKLDILKMSHASVTDTTGTDTSAQVVIKNAPKIPAMTGTYKVQLGVDHDVSGTVTKEINVTVITANLPSDPATNMPTVDPIIPSDPATNMPTVDPIIPSDPTTNMPTVDPIIPSDPTTNMPTVDPIIPSDPATNMPTVDPVTDVNNSIKVSDKIDDLDNDKNDVLPTAGEKDGSVTIVAGMLLVTLATIMMSVARKVKK